MIAAAFTRRTISLASVVLVALGVMLAVGGSVRQSYAAEKQPLPPLEYRRVFVPEADLSSEIRGLLPIKRAEFDRLIEAASAASSAQAPASGARITEADYTARLEGDQLVEGSLLAAIQQPASATTAFSLGRSNLALGSGNWLGTNTKSAVIGSDPQGGCLLVVESSGTWEQEFTLRGRREGAVLTFSIYLPPATRNRLHLDLPADLELTSSVGIVSRQDVKPNATTRRWTILLGGNDATTLSIAPTATGSNQKALILLRESASYFISPGAIDTEYQLEFDVYSRPLTELTLHLDEFVEPVAIRWGDQQLNWTTSTDADSSGKVRKTLKVPLPQPLVGQGRMIQVSTVATPPQSQQFLLPRITVDDVTWQEGRATVTASRALEMRAKAITGSWQSAVAGSSSPRWGESLQFQYHQADAAVEVTTGAPQQRLGILSGTLISIDGTQMSGVFTADITALAGDRFELEAHLARRWIVDTVESTPPNLFEERLITPIGPNLQHIRMRLTRPLREGNTIRMVIRAHQRRPAPDQEVPIEWLQMADLLTTVEAKEWLAIKSSDPSLLPQWSGDAGVTRLELQRAPTSELSLFESSPGQHCVLLDRMSSNLRLDVRRADPRFSAESSVSTTVDKRGIDHSIRIRCRPETTAISRLIVRIAPPPKEEVVWRLAGNAARATTITATQINPIASDSPEREQLWQIDFATPQGAEFELETSLRHFATTLESIPLVSLPQATSQTGTVSVEAGDATDFEAIADRLQPLPLPYASSVAAASRRTYRYDPGRNAALVLNLGARSDRATNSMKNQSDATSDSGVDETNPKKSAAQMPRGLVWSLVVHSRYPWSGDALHEATIHLENWGLDRFPFKLPAGATLQEIVVDGKRIALPLTRQPNAEISIVLPRENRHPRLAIRYLTATSASNLLGQRTLEFVEPQLSLEVVHREWLVTPPSGMQPASVGDAARLFSSDSKATPRSTATADAVEPLLTTAIGANYWNWPKLPRLISSNSALWDTSERTDRLGDENASLTDSETRWQVRLPEDQPATLVVYDPAQATTMGLASSLLALGLSMWLLRRRITLLTIIAIVLLSFSLVLPSSLMPMIAGLGFGLLAGAIGNGLVPAKGVITRPHEDHTGSTTRLLPTLTSLVMLVILAARLSGKEPTTPPATNPAAPTNGTPAGNPGAMPPVIAAPAARSVAKVVIAVDSENQPVGDYVFLPADFYELLLRRGASSNSSQSAWMLRDAQYDLLLAPSASDEVVRAEQLSATYTITTPQNATRVALSLKRNEVRLIEGRCQLDGAATSANWSADGNELLIDVPTAGDHKLALAFAIETRVEPQQSRVAIQIPSIARSTLRISSPVALQRLEVPLSLGAIESSSDEPLTQVDLGPTSQMDVTWTSLATDQLQTVLEVDQYTWCRIRPSSVVLQGHFHVRPLRGSVREVMLQVPPSLVLLPGGENPQVARTYRTEGDPATIHFELREPTASEVKLQVSFLLAGRSGVGTLQPPVVQVRADRIAKNWVAASTGPELELAEPGAETSVVDPVLFLEAWGQTGTMTGPTLVIDAAASAPSFNATPVTEAYRCEQWLDFSVARSSCKIQFQAALNGLSSQHFQHQLRLPAAVRVRRLNVREENKLANCRWSQGVDGTVSILLLEPPKPLQSIELEAVMDTPPSGKIVLKEFVVEGAQQIGSRVRLYRLPDVQLSIGKFMGMEKETNPAIGEDWPLLGRLVAEFRKTLPEKLNSSIELQVESNDPSTTGQLITTIRPTADGWQASIRASVSSSSGSLDIFRLAIPSQLETPLEITPAVDHQMIPQSIDGGRQLVVRPPKAVDRAFSFELTANIASKSGGTLRAPLATLQDIDDVSTYVVLPQRLASRAINWQTSGLQSLPRDAAVAVVADLPPSFEVFRVVGSSPSAELTLSTASENRSTLFLADYQLVAHASHEVSGTAVFLVDPAGRTSLPLKLPASGKILSATVDGHLVTPQLGAASEWNLPITQTGIPQVVEVHLILQMTSSKQGSMQQLLLPQLGTETPKRSCCSLRSPDQWSIVNLPASHQVVSTMRLDTDRLSSFVDSRQSLRASDMLELGSASIKQWLETSQAEALSVYSDLQARSTRNSPDDFVVLQSLGNKIRFAPSSTLQPGDAVAIPNWLLPRRAAEARFPFSTLTQATSGEGRLDMLEVTTSRAPLPAAISSHRGVAATVLCVIALSLLAIAMLKSLQHWLATNLGFVCVVVGLACWPLLPDAWTSLLLWVIVATIAAMQLPRRWVASAPTFSTSAVRRQPFELPGAP